MTYSAGQPSHVRFNSKKKPVFFIISNRIPCSQPGPHNKRSSSSRLHREYAAVRQFSCSTDRSSCGSFVRVCHCYLSFVSVILSTSFFFFLLFFVICVAILFIFLSKRILRDPATSITILL